MSNREFKIDDTCKSNVVSKGKPLNLEISVKATDGEGFYLTPKKNIILTNIEFEGVNLSVKYCINNAPPVSNLTKNDNNDYALKINDKRSFKSFQIIITSTEPLLTSIPGNKLILELEFTEKDADSATTLEFTVVEETSPIEITQFKSNQTIIQINKGSLSFDYKINGDSEQVILTCEGVMIETKSEKQGKFNINLANYPVNRNHYFTLQINKGDQQVSKTVCIIYVDSSQSKKRNLPPYILENGNNTVLTPINICASYDAKRLYALLRYEEKEVNKLVIGYTDHIDGDNWEFMDYIDTNDKLRYFTNSPMVHLKSKDENLGRLLFIGGSKIELNNKGLHKECAAKAGIVDLDKGRFSTVIMKKLDNDVVDAVWGHTCIVGKNPLNQQEHTIFRIGGVNKRGLCYTTFLSSTDGITWTEMDKNQLIGNKSMRWDRVAPSATFKYNNKGNKDEIWMAGGFDSFGDASIIEGEFKEAKDNNNVIIGKQWSNTIERMNSEPIIVPKDTKSLENIEINYNGLKCLSIATYTFPDGAGETGLMIIGFDKGGMKVAKSISFEAGYLELSDLKNFEIKGVEMLQTGALNTAFVNGCLFLNAISDDGQKGTKYSNNIYYYIPVLNTTTINFFNK